MTLKGLKSPDPAAKKKSGSLSLELQGQTNKAAIKITKQTVSVLKTRSRSLVDQSLKLKFVVLK